MPGYGSGNLRKRGLFRQGAAVEPGQPFILSEEKADFPGAGPDIACRDIQIVPDIFEQLRHEALAEGHNFAFGFPLAVKIRASLSASDGKAGQSILEGLFKSQKF